MAGERRARRARADLERNEICRHDVLAAGTSLVAYYECKKRFNVLKAFREPEALTILITQLAPFSTSIRTCR